MRQGMRELQFMQSMITCGSTDPADQLSFKELENQLQRETLMIGEGRILAKNLGR